MLLFYGIVRLGDANVVTGDISDDLIRYPSF
jgi:hypothetical protein